MPLVGVDPSMTLTYRFEYAKALGKDETPNVQLVQEWLATRIDQLQKSKRNGDGWRVQPAAALH